MGGVGGPPPTLKLWGPPLSDEAGTRWMVGQAPRLRTIGCLCTSSRGDSNVWLQARRPAHCPGRTCGPRPHAPHPRLLYGCCCCCCLLLLLLGLLLLLLPTTSDNIRFLSPVKLRVVVVISLILSKSYLSLIDAARVDATAVHRRCHDELVHNLSLVEKHPP